MSENGYKTNSDAFLDVNDPDAELAHIQLQEKIILKNIHEAIKRGNYRTRWLIDRFVNDLFDERAILALIERAKHDILENYREFDANFEVFGFLETNSSLKNTMLDMLDKYAESAKPRTVIDIVKTVESLDKSRFDFIRTIGYDMAVKRESAAEIAKSNEDEDEFKDLVDQGRVIEQKLNSG